METSGRASSSTKLRRPIRKSRRCHHNMSSQGLFGRVRSSRARAWQSSVIRGLAPSCVLVVGVVDHPGSHMVGSDSLHSPTPIGLWGVRAGVRLRRPASAQVPKGSHGDHHRAASRTKSWNAKWAESDCPGAQIESVQDRCEFQRIAERCNRGACIAKIPQGRDISRGFVVN